MAMEKLLTNANATGAEQKLGEGGDYVFDVAGTFGGATVKLQRKGPDNATWVDVGPEASFTVAGHVIVTLSAGLYRATVAGGTPSGLYSTLKSAF